MTARKWPLLRVIFLIAALTLLPSQSPAARSQRANALLRLDPIEVRATAGQPFTVNVAVDGASNLGSFQFTVIYDPKVFHLDKIDLGGFLGSTGRAANPLGPRPALAEAAGQVKFGAFTMGGQPGPDGSGTVAVMTFTARQPGAFDLALRDTQVTDIAGAPQPSSGQGGRAIVASSGTVLPTPAIAALVAAVILLGAIAAWFSRRRRVSR